MRNQIPQDLLIRLGNVPQPLREDLRRFAEAWYNFEQARLTTTNSGKQLRQAQGAAQVLSDLMAVLADPEAYRNNPVPAPRGLFP